ncbi:MAG TPA: hypothetical protein VE129_10855 [Thermoanaerobaculia bacterium]|nr:hypothetical protein [Thermoanaerobaculia bacterium]
MNANAGPAPLCVPPPLSSVTVYRAAPPETVTVTVEEALAQTVPPPVTVPVRLPQVTATP